MAVTWAATEGRQARKLERPATMTQGKLSHWHGGLFLLILALVATITRMPAPRQIAPEAMITAEPTSAAVFTPSGSPVERVRVCQANLKAIGTGLEMFTNDHDGHYPATLDQLLPVYLQALPACPNIGTDTYSEGYALAESPHNLEKLQDYFYLSCSGQHHGDAGLQRDLIYATAHLVLVNFEDRQVFLDAVYRDGSASRKVDRHLTSFVLLLLLLLLRVMLKHGVTQSSESCSSHGQKCGGRRGEVHFGSP